MVIVGATGLGVIVLALGSLTAWGARRRGAGIRLAVLAGVCFPLTWTAWYLRDEAPYKRADS
jgi:hypothetical protein